MSASSGLVPQWSNGSDCVHSDDTLHRFHLHHLFIPFPTQYDLPVILFTPSFSIVPTGNERVSP